MIFSVLYISYDVMNVSNSRISSTGSKAGLGAAVGREPGRSVPITIPQVPHSF